jgi:hypothetical protein
VVVAVDTSASKRTVATSFGATHGVDPAEEDTAASVRALTGGRGADFVFVGVGYTPVIEAALGLVRRGGTVVVLGMPASDEIIGVVGVDLVHDDKRILGHKIGSDRARWRTSSRGSSRSTTTAVEAGRADHGSVSAFGDQRGDRVGVGRGCAAQRDRLRRRWSPRVNTEVFITCAVTGVGATTDRSERVPVTTAEIADAALEAARAGAAIVHIHVREPETGGPSRDPGLYREVVERIRSSDVDVVHQPHRRHGRRPRAGRRRVAAASEHRGEPTWRARPSGCRTSPSCGRRFARSTAGR